MLTQWQDCASTMEDYSSYSFDSSTCHGMNSSWSQDPPSPGSPGSIAEIVDRVKVIMELGFDEGMKALGLPNPYSQDWSR